MDKGIIDYSNCITNLTSSIEKYYNLKPRYSTLSSIDAILASKQWKNIVILVFDALGSAVLKRNKIKDSFLLDNKIADMVSCYPSTTATCTTAFKSGMNAIESAWIGWSTHISRTKFSVELFTNKNYEKKELITNIKYADYFKYPILGNRIHNKNKDVEYCDISKGVIGLVHGEKLRDRTENLVKKCNEDKKHYIYFYWGDPDKTMHRQGVENENVKEIIKDITKNMEYALQNTKDTLFILSADHGMIDVKNMNLWEEKDIVECFRAFPSVDSRTLSLFIKKGMKTIFKERFLHRYGKHYTLHTKQEVLKNNLFGYGKQNSKVNSLLGDYIAIARDEYYINCSPNFKIWKGHHAGLTDDEMQIPLIVFSN